ncbi:hypothetical protein NM688_g4686 [Phlebia brevispora]|uniref:Uncharacterized protein n=1 Tax=Phlebia brevispora TaxID=194682 RepID=A0ACC1T2U1_9APHY|nr:hypothetical protein NM688_g4686 [Phlebia brevispora]
MDTLHTRYACTHAPALYGEAQDARPLPYCFFPRASQIYAEETGAASYPCGVLVLEEREEHTGTLLLSNSLEGARFPFAHHENDLDAVSRRTLLTQKEAFQSLFFALGASRELAVWIKRDVKQENTDICDVYTLVPPPCGKAFLVDGTSGSLRTAQIAYNPGAYMHILLEQLANRPLGWRVLVLLVCFAWLNPDGQIARLREASRKRVNASTGLAGCVGGGNRAVA